jgi:hypothetical protein
MRRLVRILQHAFSTAPAPPFQPTAEQQAFVERVCVEIARRELTPLAIVTLESLRPLQYVGAQSLHFLTPLLSAFGDAPWQQELVTLLGHPGALDYVMAQLENVES